MATTAIIGANMAGGRAAEALRQGGYDGRIVLVGAEPERPYERPPLSKGYLLGDGNESELFLRPTGYYDEHGIEYRLGTRAVALDIDDATVELDDGGRLRYDALLIATGASARRLDVPGAGLDGVLTLRSLADARGLRARLRRGNARRVAVVGAGFIGVEIAASCRELGLDVVMLEQDDLPLERAFGREIGAIVADIHRERGVDLRTGERVSEFRGSSGRVTQVVTASGAEVACDVAVVGIGAVPEVAWLAGSGVEIARGVLVDELCRTNVPGIFAAGDVAEWWHPGHGRRLLVEHVDNAANQGVAAARSMLGAGTPYAPAPYFWSDQYDLSFQYAGHAPRYDRLIMRGSPAERTFVAFYMTGDRFAAVLAVNRFRDFSAARRLLAAGTPVSAAQLADESFDLRTLRR